MGKESACNAGDAGDQGLIPGSGRFPGEGNGNPLQYSCLDNLMDRGAWCPWGRKESDMTERFHFLSFLFLLLFPLLWEVGHRGSCCGLCQRVFCLCFPLEVFIVSDLTFRSLLHFVFIFVYVRKCYSFILLQLFDQFPQHHL